MPDKFEPDDNKFGPGESDSNLHSQTTDNLKLPNTPRLESIYSTQLQLVNVNQENGEVIKVSARRLSLTHSGSANYSEDAIMDPLHQICYPVRLPDGNMILVAPLCLADGISQSEGNLLGSKYVCEKYVELWKREFERYSNVIKPADYRFENAINDFASMLSYITYEISQSLRGKIEYKGTTFTASIQVFDPKTKAQSIVYSNIGDSKVLRVKNKENGRVSIKCLTLDDTFATKEIRSILSDLSLKGVVRKDMREEEVNLLSELLRLTNADIDKTLRILQNMHLNGRCPENISYWYRTFGHILSNFVGYDFEGLFKIEIDNNIKGSQYILTSDGIERLLNYEQLEQLFFEKGSFEGAIRVLMGEENSRLTTAYPGIRIKHCLDNVSFASVRFEVV